MLAACRCKLLVAVRNSTNLWRAILLEVDLTKQLFRDNFFSTYFVCLNLGLKLTLVVFATSRSAQHTLSVPSWSLHSNLTLTQIDLASKIQYDEPADKTGRFLFSALPMIMLRPLCTPRMIAVDEDGRKLTFFFSPPFFCAICLTRQDPGCVCSAPFATPVHWRVLHTQLVALVVK